MSAPNLDIDLLRSFAAIADSGSFTAASEIVSRTQSAVSVQIRRLEQVLGRRVFERTSRSLVLTPAGETLLGYARRILALNDESVRRISEPPVSGLLRLGITEYFVPGELPAILSRFAQAYPGVELEAHMGLSRDLRQRLAAGALDAALVRLAPRETGQGLWSEAQVWVCREGSEPAAGEPVPLVLLPPPCVLREHAIATMKARRRPWKVVFTGSSMASVHAAIDAGLGVSIVPRSSVRPGMHVLPRGDGYPAPPLLKVGLLRRAGAPADALRALERVVLATLEAVEVRRAP